MVILVFFFTSQAYSSSASSFAQSPVPGGSDNASQNSSLNSTSPVYFWFFGYIGSTFYPSSELNISQNAMISAAKSLSNEFGKTRVVLLTAVDEIPLPGGTISKSNISQIASYVSSLKQYAAAVYGRLDFYQFNLTATDYGNCNKWNSCPIYNQSSLLINRLGLDGIWFDHPSQYNNVVGNLTFNQMMQNLTNLFPNAKYILNQTPGAKLGYVRELNGFSWENETYVAPSPPQRSLDMNQKQLQILNQYYPGHVIAHLDAEGPPQIGSNPFEPMSIFADSTGTQEISVLNTLVYNGTHPALMNESYAMVIPLIGAWTCNCTAYGTNGPNYNGTLYNALYTGTFARSTVANFEQIAIAGGSMLLFSKNSVASNQSTCLLKYVVKGNELALGVSVKSTGGSNPVSIQSVKDTAHDRWSLRVNASQQNNSSGEFALAAIYSAIALKTVYALSITVTFSASSGISALGSIGCYALVGNYTGTNLVKTSGTFDENSPTYISTNPFTPHSNSIELAVSSVRSGGCKSCTISAGYGYSPNLMKPNGGQPATGMEFKYPSGEDDVCDFSLSGFQGSSVGADVCIAFTTPAS